MEPTEKREAKAYHLGVKAERERVLALVEVRINSPLYRMEYVREMFIQLRDAIQRGDQPKEQEKLEEP